MRSQQSPIAGADLRRANTAACAVALRDLGAASLTQLAERTALSRPTVLAAVEDLSQRGLVREHDELRNAGVGRPTRTFEFVAEHAVVVGIDLGANRSRIVVTDLAGATISYLGRDVTAGDAPLGPDTLIGFVEEALVRAGLDPLAVRVAAIGLSITGFVDADGTVILSYNLPQWMGLNPVTLLSDRFGCPVPVDNDTRLAPLAEYRLGAARGADSVVYLLAGHRFSVGSMIHGRVVRGAHNAAGEVGDLLFGLPEDDLATRWHSASTTREVFDKAAAGDPTALAEVDDLVAIIARGVAIVAMTIDPELLVIGGGLSQAGETFLGPIRRELAQIVRLPIEHTVVASELGDAGALLGALCMAFDSAGAELFGIADLPQPALNAALR